MEGMLDVDRVYGSGERFLNTEGCSKQKLWGKKLTVTGVSLREIRERQKICLKFQEINDILILNKTNATILADKWGADASLWVGKQLKLRKTKRQFAGKPIDAIEVEAVQD